MADHNRQTSRRTLRFLTLASLTFALIAAEFLSAQQFSESPKNPTLAELRVGFATPPPSARLRCYWWWLNGNTDKATITHDLEEMKAKGFGGVLLVDANGSNQNGNRNVPPVPPSEVPPGLTSTPTPCAKPIVSASKSLSTLPADGTSAAPT